jgi:RNA-binding protein YlmH
MRVQLIIFLLFSSLAMAGESQEIEELMDKYVRITKSHHTDLVEDVFSEKFLKDNDGKEEFIEKIKSLPKMEEKFIPVSRVEWKQGMKGKIIFVKLKVKQKKARPVREGEFILIRENGKLKIDGTLSDG